MIRLYDYFFKYSFINKWAQKYNVRIDLKDEYHEFLGNFDNEEDRKIVNKICENIDFISNEKYKELLEKYLKKLAIFNKKIGQCL